MDRDELRARLQGWAGTARPGAEALRYAAYEEVLETVVERAGLRAGHRVLVAWPRETGLVLRCLEQGTTITLAGGERLDQLIEELDEPEVVTVRPLADPGDDYDAVVSAYGWQKVGANALAEGIGSLVTATRTGGRLVLAGIAFANESAAAAARETFDWLGEERYPLLAELVAAFAAAGLELRTTPLTPLVWLVAAERGQ